MCCKIVFEHCVPQILLKRLSHPIFALFDSFHYISKNFPSILISPTCQFFIFTESQNTEKDDLIASRKFENFSFVSQLLLLISCIKYLRCNNSLFLDIIFNMDQTFQHNDEVILVDFFTSSTNFFNSFYLFKQYQSISSVTPNINNSSKMSF